MTSQVVDEVAALRHALAQYVDIPHRHAPIADDRISLIVFDEQVLFVHWFNVSIMEARPVRLDKFNRVLYNVGYGIKNSCIRELVW